MLTSSCYLKITFDGWKLYNTQCLSLAMPALRLTKDIVFECVCAVSMKSNLHV